MTALATTHPTFVDLANTLDPNGNVAKIAEILNKRSDVLLDMTWQEGNLTNGHKSSLRTGLPNVTWRKMYGGVQPSKSATATVETSCGMLEAYAEIDKKLADLNNNSAAWRLQEEKPFIESMGQEIAKKVFYGNEGTEPEAFTGLSSYYNSLSAANGENILNGGGVGSDNASVWLVIWSPDTVFGIVPKGSKAGIQVEDKGQVTLENVDGNGGRMEAYRTHYEWDAGMHLRDWRFCVRIANIDKSNLVKDASSGADLADLMFQAIDLIPEMGVGRPAFYMPRYVRTKLRQQCSYMRKGSTLEVENVGGNPVEFFHGIPLRRVDALAADEAVVS